MFQICSSCERHLPAMHGGQNLTCKEQRWRLAQVFADLKIIMLKSTIRPRAFKNKCYKVESGWMNRNNATLRVRSKEYEFKTLMSLSLSEEWRVCILTYLSWG